VEIGNMPFTPYDYNRVANFNPYQFAGMDMTAQRAMQQGGLPQQAEGTLGNILGGGGMYGPMNNPYANAFNAYNGSQTGVGANPYGGSNPYLEQNIQNTLGDVANTYNQQVAPQMAAQAYKSGSFGNTGQQEMENQSRNMLQRNMGQISGNMRMQDYGMQQQLAESDITRRMQARQADLARNASMYGQDLSRNAATYGQQNALNLQGFQQGIGNTLQGLSMAPSIYGLGYMPGQQMLGIGATMQQQGQNTLDKQYEEFMRAQQYPYMNYAAMQGPLGRTGMNTSTTQPGTSMAAGVLGGAMLGNQLWNSFGSGTGSSGYPSVLNPNPYTLPGTPGYIGPPLP
jgi:hypothetical protein